MTVLIREVATGLAVRDDAAGEARILYGPLIPWGVEARVLDRGRLVVETFQRGALADADPARVPLTVRHPKDSQELPIGVGVELRDEPDAMHGAWHVSKTAAGDEVLELARDGVPLGLSIGFMEVAGGSRWSPDRRRVVRTRVTSTTPPSSEAQRLSAPGLSGCARQPPAPSTRFGSWPCCAVGKSRNLWVAPARGSGKRSPPLCLGCGKRIFFGERCPPCATEVRVRAAKRRRRR